MGLPVKQMHILVVDDEPFNREILAEVLDDPAYRISVAEDGGQAWDRLTADGESFDLVLLDRMMPGMDGLEVLRRMKDTPRLRDLPVIMQTAAASPDQVREGIAAGAYYYLTKPFELETLLTIVRAALDDASQRTRLQQQLNDHAGSLALVVNARFEFRTLEEAQHLAVVIAGMCANTELVAMGLSELLINAVEHGNLGITFEEKTRLKEQDGWQEEVERRLGLPENLAKRAVLSVRRIEGGWEFEVCDEGEGFDWPRFLELAPERAFAPNGRGIALARQLAFSELEYLDGGRRVRVRTDA